MATLFEPSFSASGMRQSSSHATAPSMADTIPGVNFGFEDLRKRMTRFSVRFDEFIAAGRKRVLEERNQFRAAVAELQEDQRLKQRSIEILKTQSSTHARTIAKEEAETQEMQLAITSITAARDIHLSRKSRLKSDASNLKNQVSQRRDAQRQYSKAIDEQAQRNGPELEFWIEILCLRIEAVGIEDRLKFVYTHVDEGDWEREAWFEIDMGNNDYELVEWKPKVGKERVMACLGRFNESKDIGIFLKGMREVFIDSFKE